MSAAKADLVMVVTEEGEGWWHDPRAGGAGSRLLGEADVAIIEAAVSSAASREDFSDLLEDEG